jgi:hypothetical protein
MKKQKNAPDRYFGKNRKILKRANFERSPRDLCAEYQKSVLPDFSKYSQDTAENEEDPVENKKMARSDVLVKLSE